MAIARVTRYPTMYLSLGSITDALRMTFASGTVIDGWYTVP